MKQRLLCFLLILLAFFSCTKEEVRNPSAPAWYADLYRLYQSKDVCVGIEEDSAGYVFSFQSGFSLRINSNGFFIDDCTQSQPRIVGTRSDGEFTVGGEPTGIYLDNSVDKLRACPVYLYFDTQYIYVTLSSSERMCLSVQLKEPEKEEEEEEKDNGSDIGKSLPVLRITTDGYKHINSKYTYVPGSIVIENPDKMYCDETYFEGRMQIKGRGNSTWDMPKKPYRIKLDEKSKILGMKGDKDWVLLAEYADKSLLRNITAMQLSRIAGMSWTPEMRSVEVYLNNVYKGVYTLAEHKEVGTSKVNIDLEAGDMYFELEQNQDEPVCWWTEHGAPVMCIEPAYPTSEQLRMAKDQFYQFETALWAKNFEKAYSYIDLESFVNYYIVEEITKDIDGNIRKSTFLTLQPGGKLVMYHLWDFDLTLGNCNYYDDGNNGPTGWWIKDYGYWGKNHGWYYRLFMDPNFVKMVQKRWDELYPLLFEVPDYIDYNVALLGDAPERNFNTWRILNTYVWPNYKIPGSYQGEIDWLKTFYTQRLAWLNNNIKKL